MSIKRHFSSIIKLEQLSKDWKKLKSSINPRFALLGLLGFSLVPFVWVIFTNVQKLSEVKMLREEMVSLDLMAMRAKIVQKDQTQFWKRHGEADHYYLDNEVESMRLLNSEVLALQSMMDHPAFNRCAALEKRLGFLTREENQLIFAEIGREKGKVIEETSHKLLKAVEMNLEDLKQLLSKIEGLSVEGPIPQLIIRKFQLKRHLLSSGGENYLICLELIKREKAP